MDVNPPIIVAVLPLCSTYPIIDGLVPRSFSTFYLFFDHLWYAKMKARINWNKANCWEMGQSLPIIAT